MRRVVFVAMMVLLLVPPAPAQMAFKRVELRNSYGSAKQGSKGKLIMDRKNLQFVGKSGKATISIPTEAVTELFYSRVTGRRIKSSVTTAILVWPAAPILFFSKGRKHYMTITFDDGGENVGAVEFKMHKSNYRSFMRGLEQVTGLSMLYDQEGPSPKEGQTTPADRKRK